ncbi:helix-turn-helix transcriptional regulator [Pseudorhodoferax sp. Leaf267]|uniref:helix-turn-helix transcriptional regulator n=1 Tax=Pseudorhodoferax sp. Leaf267 TaxID=1736316 RepID=UPI0012E26DC0|nr:helix-turn-helix transcriptional regulator [Pseudorhodoferax sp. Leaf267]
MLELQTPDAICQMLGERVRALRLARNLSQQELADRAGASLSTIRRFEASGQGSMLLMVQLAQALQASDGLQHLLTLPTRSIAEAEAAVQLSTRQRARKPRQPQRSGG